MTQNDEVQLSCKNQPKEVINLFTIIYIILNENYLEIPTQSLILNLSQVILKKYNVNSISKNIFYYYYLNRTIINSNITNKN